MAFSCYRDGVYLSAVLGSAIGIAARRSGRAVLQAAGNGWEVYDRVPGSVASRWRGWSDVAAAEISENFVANASGGRGRRVAGAWRGGTRRRRSGPVECAVPAAGQARVSERLAAIRDAVSDVAAPSALKAGEQLAWWAWRNGGGGLAQRRRRLAQWRRRLAQWRLAQRRLAQFLAKLVSGSRQGRV